MIGIDLGTTHSLISVWKDQKPILIPNQYGKMLTPSVVALDEEGHLLVGDSALKKVHALRNFKRYMGTAKKFLLGNESFLPEELSAMVLKSLIRDAEAFLGTKVTEAVITVPAYFNNAQRKATHLAGKLAGVQVERLINEPTAAALVYGLHKRDLETKFLVFDLGGGTFDVSIVELFSGVIEVCSSAGDNYLGGEDFSQLIAEFIKGQLWKRFQIDLIELPQEVQQSFYEQTHIVKHALSSHEETTFQITLDEQEVVFPFTRSQFQKLASPLFDRLQAPLEQALSDARIRPHELDAVILVGGATRMPLIQSAIAKMLGLFPQTAVHPDEAVALGAGVQAALKERHEELRDVVITDICPFSLGTSIYKTQYQTYSFCPIIERNTTIPTSRVSTFWTTLDQQTRMCIDVYQGESYKLSDNIKIGEFEILVPPASASQESVDVRFSYDINGLLEVEATVNSTGDKKKILIQNQDHHLSDEEVQNSLRKLTSLKIHPRDLPENRAIMTKLESLFEFHRGETRQELASMIDEFNAALNTQNPHTIEEIKQALYEYLDYSKH